MKTVLYTFALLLAFLLTQCSGGKQLTQTTARAESAYQAGNYDQAITYFEEVIRYYEDAGNTGECPVYEKAALAAEQAGQTGKAISFLETNRYTRFATPDTWFSLSRLYREIGNISKEIEALEAYLEKYPEADRAEEAKTRLFDIYIETANWESADNQWELISPASRDARLGDCFLFNRGLRNDEACDTLAIRLLEKDKENPMALEWMAKKLFWKAERLYQAELKAYNENKTNKQYKQLLKALDTVTADFKTSLDYFQTLYTLQPSPEFAKYMGDIYTRLDDKQKANYYYQKSSGNN